MERVICIVIGYVLGLFQTGFIYGKFKNIDIRDYGSGNAGTTNALRTLGWKAGLITFFGDFTKCLLAVIICKVIFGGSYGEELPLLGMYAGVGAILGHNFPFYLKFKGGKGIAATAGLLVGINFPIALIAGIAFFITVFLTRYISLGSIVLVIVFAIEIVIYGQMGGFGMSSNLLYEMYAVVVFLMFLAIYRHKENIKRLRQGTENKFGTKKKGE